MQFELSFPAPTREQLEAARVADERAVACEARAGHCETLIAPDASSDFITEWDNALALRIARAEARILRQGGCDTFLGLFTTRGVRLRATLITREHASPRERYVWRLFDARGRTTRHVVARDPRRLEALGLVESTEIAPARVEVHAGTDDNEHTHLWVAIERTDVGYPREAMPDA